jgi:hypothetical protein
MLLGLIGMGIFGIICLILINLYHKETVTGGINSLPPTATARECGRSSC